MINSFKNKKTSYYLVFSFYFLGFGLVIALSASIINYYDQQSEIEHIVSEQAIEEKNIKTRSINDFIRSGEKQLSALTHNQLFLNYVKSKSKNNLNLVNNLFFYLSESDTNIMQVRYIDNSGKEKIRVERKTKIHNNT